MKAIWNGKVIAESNKTVEVEGNPYFPIDSVNREYLNKSGTQTFCPWKGTASYYNLQVAGKIYKDAAWSYLTPSKAAEKITGHLAFWRGVEVVN
jgi:uncharacterized protein (DUF427 family)